MAWAQRWRRARDENLRAFERRTFDRHGREGEFRGCKVKIKERYNRDDFLRLALPQVKASDRLPIFKKYLRAKGTGLTTGEAVEKYLSDHYSGDCFKYSRMVHQADRFRTWYESSHREQA